MADEESSSSSPTNDTVADANWKRWRYAIDRGHGDYISNAIRCEQYYLGAQHCASGARGGHWLDADRQTLRDTGNRPAYEFNEVFPAVNSAIGYQIHNRMDISYLPRGEGSDQEMAELRSKVAMQVCDHNKFHWLETQVFSDGLIEQRGYYDIRMNFDNNVFGDIDIGIIDPRDVAPDPDAKTYEPNGWGDVLVARWPSLDDIEQHYGKEARDKLSANLDVNGDWGDFDETGGPRNKFGDSGTSQPMWDYFTDEDGVRRYRVLDRQRWVYKMTKVVIYPTGEIKNVDSALPEQLMEYARLGARLSKRMMRSVHWTVTTRYVTLFDEVSPYDRFTVIPYFAFFRRGRTRGLIDNGISPQDVLNKAISQFIHIINTTANSGWIVEENSLVDMAPEDLEKEGSKTGLLVVFKQGTTPPQKIEPNKIPPGMDRIIEIARTGVRAAMIDPSLRGADEKEESGIARQSQQFAAQQGLAIPLDNLSRTRHMVAEMIDHLMTVYYDNNRLIRITESDPQTGQDVDKSFRVNEYNPATRTFLNDLTEGDYDVVVSEAPMQITFENSQFEQALSMRKEGVALPDQVLVKHSNLTDKNEILQQMASNQPEPTPLEQAETAYKQAQTIAAQAQARLNEQKAIQTQAQTTEINVTSQFGAVQAANAVAIRPDIAVVADQILGSAGYVDHDASPVISTPAGPPLALPPPAGAALGVRQNTHPGFPLKPTTPQIGLDAGIEGGRVK